MHTHTIWLSKHLRKSRTISISHELLFSLSMYWVHVIRRVVIIISSVMIERHRIHRHQSLYQRLYVTSYKGVPFEITLNQNFLAYFKYLYFCIEFSGRHTENAWTECKLLWLFYFPVENTLKWEEKSNCFHFKSAFHMKRHKSV